MGRMNSTYRGWCRCSRSGRIPGPVGYLHTSIAHHHGDSVTLSRPSPSELVTQSLCCGVALSSRLRVCCAGAECGSNTSCDCTAARSLFLALVEHWGGGWNGPSLCRTAPPRPVAMHMPAAPSQAAVLGCWMELSDGHVKGV